MRMAAPDIADYYREMQLTERQYRELRESQQLHLTLIGMSNIGKTFQSEHLEQAGFTHINCDDEVEHILAENLRAEGFTGGIEEMASWLGLPYEDRYAAHQMSYLNAERTVMEKLLNSQMGVAENIVIDTTGSVVHLGDEICSQLGDRSVVIYLSAPQDHVEQLYRRYLEKPKPVVFGEYFQLEPDESPTAGLGRCYGNLLRARNELYERYADVTIDREDIDYSATTEDFLSLVGEKLKLIHAS